MAAALCGGCSSETEHPWTSTSQHLEMTCGSFFEGSMTFRADRSELSQEQLDLLADFETTEENDCSEDAASCKIEITDRDGSKATFRAVEQNGTCGSSGHYLAYDTVAPFVATIPCQFGKWEGASEPLNADARCLHGMFSPSGGGGITKQLSFDEPGRSYHVELDQCDEPRRQGQVAMKLRTEGPPLVARDVAAGHEDGACLELDFTPEAATTLELEVTTTAEFLPAGDFALQFR